MPYNWIEIKTKGPGTKKDEAVSLLIGSGCPGVLEEEISFTGNILISHSLDHREIREEKEKPVISCKAYLPAGSSQKLSGLKKTLKKVGWDFYSSPYREEDWSKRWRSRISPVMVSYGNSSIIVKPTWKDVKKKPGDVVIEIDPGMAFGTGGHATTKMCLKALLTILRSRKETGLLSGFLDIGTGTGILAIAAKKLKIKKAFATDIDPDALKAARKNSRLNNVAITVSGSPIDKVKGVYPIVAANILAGELTRLSRDIVSHLGKNGFLILSGILKEEAEALKKTYEPLGLKHAKTYSSKEWAALVFSNNSGG